MTETLHAPLYSIPADDRETWVQVGMALHAELGAAGFDLWDSWSRQSESYKSADAKAVWRGFKQHGGITIASLYHLAKLHGWQGEAPVALELSSEEKLRRVEESLREGVARDRAAERAAQVATKMLGEAELLPHPYLAAKGFPEANGLVIAKDNLLLVPMRNVKTGAVQSLQTITPDGQKRFLAGGRAKGGVFNLGRSSTRWYCEGYATGLSVQAALRRMYRDDQVVVCFSAANLAHVANPAPSSPRPRYVIADHDLYKCGNKCCGHTWSKVGLPFDTTCPQCGRSVVPPAGEKNAVITSLPYWMPPEPGDANDFHQAHGIHALAEGLREALRNG